MGENNNFTQIKLDRSEKKFKVLFENSPIGMAMVNHATGDFLEVNQSLLKATGYTKEEFLNLSFWDITPPEYEEQEGQQIIDLNKTGRFGPNEKEYIRKDGTRFPIRISGFMMEEPDGTLVVWGLIEDISERKAYERELTYLATHDTLTGLANRRLFSERISYTLDYCEREQKLFAVLIVDLDKFKFINDSLGHHSGDIVLQKFSERVGKLLKRKTDTFARTGGDEFMILLSLISDPYDVDMIAGRIVDALREPFVLGKHKVHVTCSIGSSVYPYHGKDVEVLIKHADASAYHVKRSGGNGYMMWEDQM